jgi:hypothetical protein
MFLVLNTRQFNLMDSGKAGGASDQQLMQSLNNDSNHEQSAIIINQSQLD